MPDVIVMAAAVADYRAAEVAELKRSKEERRGPAVTLELVENEDILAGLVARGPTARPSSASPPRRRRMPRDLRERGRRKRRRKGVDLLAVNEVGWSKGFETADNALVVIDADDEVVASPRGSKREVADALWDAVPRREANQRES